ILKYDPADGPKQVVPSSVLLPLGAGTGIGDASALESQQSLRFLSLEHNRITDVRPFTRLAQLSVLRLDDNAIQNIEDLLGHRVVDDGDPAFAVFGDWEHNFAPADAAFEGDYRFRFGLAGGTLASWSFDGLEPGNYEVLVTWLPDAGRSDHVTYQVVSRDTTAIVSHLDLFNAGLTSPVAFAPGGGHTVTINTNTGTIVGDDADPATFYGAPFIAGITADGKAQFLVLGNLNIPADTLNVVGSRPLSIVVGNDVTVAPGAVFNASAIGTQAGPGGGTPGGGGGGGGGGAGGGRGSWTVRGATFRHHRTGGARRTGRYGGARRSERHRRRERWRWRERMRWRGGWSWRHGCERWKRRRRTQCRHRPRNLRWRRWRRRRRRRRWWRRRRVVGRWRWRRWRRRWRRQALRRRRRRGRGWRLRRHGRHRRQRCARRSRRDRRRRRWRLRG